MPGGVKAPASVLRAFLAGRGDVSRAADANGWTALHLVCYLPFEGSEECLDLILKSGGDVGAKTVEGLVPLHLACCDGRVGTILRLLAQGARVNSRSSDRQTPLMYAAKSGNEHAVALLIERGANMDDQCAAGKSALHYAATAGSHHVAEALLKRGARPDLRDVEGKTAADRASENERHDLADYLRGLAARAPTGADAHPARSPKAIPPHTGRPYSRRAR
jgi:ankyrin repeat protein